MRVLVAASSRHGATWELAEAISRTLAERGLEVEVARPEEVASVEEFDAVVLGSAVYVGQWLPAARAFVEEHATDLAARPTWLFSSGPIGDPPKPAANAVQVDALVERTQARGHRLFAGRIDRSGLGLAERAVLAAVRAREGDFRDWDAVTAWAHELADALRVGAEAHAR